MNTHTPLTNHEAQEVSRRTLEAARAPALEGTRKSGNRLTDHSVRRVLMIRDINALTAEEMRVIIQDVLASQRLDQVDRLIKHEAATPGNHAVNDPLHMPEAGASHAGPDRCPQCACQHSSGVSGINQPERRSLDSLMPVSIRVRVMQPSTIGTFGEGDDALCQITIPLHIDTVIPNG